MSTTTVHAGAKTRRAVQADARRDAIAKQMKATAHREAPSPMQQTVKIGPIKALWPTNPAATTIDAVPTVETIVDDVVAAVIDTHPVSPGRPFSGQSFTWERRLDVKTHRRIAKAQLQRRGFIDPATGKPHTLASLGPLVTAVRKGATAQLRSLHRDAERAYKRAERDRERALAREQAHKERLLIKSAAKAGAILPKGAKPSRGLPPKTNNQPALDYVYVVRLKSGWALAATDKHTLTVIPLRVKNETTARLSDGMPISQEAIAAIEKAGAFIVNRQGAVVPRPVQLAYSAYYTASGNHAGYATQYVLGKDGPGYSAPEWITSGRNALLTGAKVESRQGLMPRAPAPSKRIQVTLDATQLAALQASHGSKSITLVIDQGALDKREDGVRVAKNSTAIRVQDNPTEKKGVDRLGVGCIMPVRPGGLQPMIP